MTLGSVFGARAGSPRPRADQASPCAAAARRVHRCRRRRLADRLRTRPRRRRQRDLPVRLQRLARRVRSPRSTRVHRRLRDAFDRQPFRGRARAERQRASSTPTSSIATPVTTASSGGWSTTNTYRLFFANLWGPAGGSFTVSAGVRVTCTGPSGTTVRCRFASGPFNMPASFGSVGPVCAADEQRRQRRSEPATV